MSFMYVNFAFYSINKINNKPCIRCTIRLFDSPQSPCESKKRRPATYHYRGEKIYRMYFHEYFQTASPFLEHWTGIQNSRTVDFPLLISHHRTLGKFQIIVWILFIPIIELVRLVENFSFFWYLIETFASTKQKKVIKNVNNIRRLLNIFKNYK